VHANVVSRYSAHQTASSRLAARGDAGGEPPDMFCVHTRRLSMRFDNGLRLLTGGRLPSRRLVW